MNNVYDEGAANYNALQSALSYRAGNAQLSVAYTFSKALTTLGPHGSGATTAQGQSAQNPRGFHAEYVPPSYDFTNDISATWVYEIPYFQKSHKLMQEALAHWSLARLFLHQSGFAQSVSMGNGTAGLAVRPDQVGDYRKIGKLDEWFDTSTFQAPEYGFFGDAKNGTIRGPGYTSINVSLYKRFPLFERALTEFRAEAFNVLNHSNFQSVSTGYGSATFGQVTSAGDPRILEFAMKVMF
jgi:hypothetical protein